MALQAAQYIRSHCVCRPARVEFDTKTKTLDDLLKQARDVMAKLHSVEHLPASSCLPLNPKGPFSLHLFRQAIVLKSVHQIGTKPTFFPNQEDIR